MGPERLSRDLNYGPLIRRRVLINGGLEVGLLQPTAPLSGLLSPVYWVEPFYGSNREWDTIPDRIEDTRLGDD